MKVKQPATLLAVFLFVFSISLVMYRIIYLKYPVLPTIPGQAWQFSFEGNIVPEDERIVVTLALPTEQSGRFITEEYITSDTLNFTLFQEGMSRIGLWSGITEKESVIISYKGTLLLRPKRFPPSQNPYISADLPNLKGFEKAPLLILSNRLKRMAPQARLKVITSIIKGGKGGGDLNREDLEVWNALKAEHGDVNGILIILKAAGFSARAASGLILKRGIQTRPSTWIEIWDKKEWHYLDPVTGVIYDPSILLPLSTANMPVLKVEKGRAIEMRWSLEREVMSKWRHHFERIKRSQKLLDRWSFFSIPEEFQNIFRVLFLVPLGALIVCILRNIIGFPTFGIFMPVLLALAFRSSGLGYGIAIFVSVVLIGYLIRCAINRFRLLLVPRLSVILTLVIICFGIFALIGGKLELRALMGVGLLPIVIITMSIERFFILIEESGITEALKTAIGTIAISVITFFVIQWEPLQLTFFIYPELLLTIAGCQILLGRYTGYRLSELLRFKALTKENS